MLNQFDDAHGSLLKIFPATLSEGDPSSQNGTNEQENRGIEHCTTHNHIHTRPEISRNEHQGHKLSQRNGDDHTRKTRERLSIL